MAPAQGSVPPLFFLVALASGRSFDGSCRCDPAHHETRDGVFVGFAFGRASPPRQRGQEPQRQNLTQRNGGHGGRRLWRPPPGKATCLVEVCAPLHKLRPGTGPLAHTQGKVMGTISAPERRTKPPRPLPTLARVESLQIKVACPAEQLHDSKESVLVSVFCGTLQPSMSIAARQHWAHREATAMQPRRGIPIKRWQPQSRKCCACGHGPPWLAWPANAATSPKPRLRPPTGGRPWLRWNRTGRAHATIPNRQVARSQLHLWQWLKDRCVLQHLQGAREATQSELAQSLRENLAMYRDALRHAGHNKEAVGPHKR